MNLMKQIWLQFRYLAGRLVGKINLHGHDGSSVEVSIDEIIFIDYDTESDSIVIVEKGKIPIYVPITDWNVHVAASHAAHLIERMKKASARIKRKIDPSNPYLPEEPSPTK
ncbi:hypothetical protein [Aquitalea pelogenes]|uniref:hypothetical protein n=1 Tax=Aquitalea pelogenes TaxID=1293573 RepID=UPI0035B243D7